MVQLVQVRVDGKKDGPSAGEAQHRLTLTRLIGMYT